MLAFSRAWEGRACSEKAFSDAILSKQPLPLRAHGAGQRRGSELPQALRLC